MVQASASFVKINEIIHTFLRWYIICSPVSPVNMLPEDEWLGEKVYD